jgi:hypothetical protein
MAPPVFGKLGSKVKDLFTKKYDYSNEIKVTSKADPALTLEACGSDAGKEGLQGKTTFTYKSSDFGEAELNVATDAAVNGKVKFDKFQDGLDVTVSGCCAKMAPTVEVNHKTDAMSSVLKFKTDGAKHNLDVSTVYKHDAFAVGVSASTADFGSLSDYNAGVEYSAGDISVTAVSSKCASTVQLSFLQRWTKSLVWGARMNVLPECNNISIGCENQLDDSTIVKAAVTTEGVVSTAVEHVLADPKFKMNLAAEFDTNNGMTAQKFGVGLSFGDF